MYDQIKLLVEFAEREGLTVHLSVHNVTDEQGLALLQSGAFDLIEPGAGGNPPTGRLKNTSQANASVFFKERHR